MPLVIVSRNPRIVLDEAVIELGVELPGIIATHLRCDDPDGGLTPEEIEIWFREPGQFDRNWKDLEINVFANDYPARAANVKQRAHAIQLNLVVWHKQLHLPEMLFRENRGFVWIHLGKGGFKDFSPQPVPVRT